MVETAPIHEEPQVEPMSYGIFPDFDPLIELTNDFTEFLLLMHRKRWDSWEAFVLN